MKTSNLNLTLKLFSFSLLTVLAATSHAADIVKTNNADALNVPTSWTNNAVPTAADLAIFDSTLDGSFSSYDIGGPMTWNGISFRDAAVAQSITGASTLTLANGSPGIDMTAAAVADFTISCPVNLGTSGGQTYHVENSAQILSVGAAISGTGPLRKTGAGTFLTSANTAYSYTGGTIISGGTLRLGVNYDNILAPGTVTVTNGGTLDFSGAKMTGKDYSFRIAGPGVDGLGALVSNAGGQENNALTNLVLDADASIGGTVRFGMRRPSAGAVPFVDLQGHTLTKVGVNQFWIDAAGATITSGNLTAQEGLLGVSEASLAGTGMITVKNAAQFVIWRGGSQPAATTITRPMTLEGGGIFGYNGNNTGDAIDQSIGANITLVDLSTVNVAAAGAVMQLSGLISGLGGFDKTGSGELSVSGVSTHSGDTSVSQGLLTLGSTWSGSGAVTVNDSATLGFKPTAANAVVNLNSLTLGNGGSTIVTFNMGGFANPSGTVVNVTNAITLNGTTTLNFSSTTGLTPGTFKVFTFGSIEGAGGFVLGGVSGFSSTLATNGNSIEVTIAPGNMSWRGTATGTWQTSTPANLDWYNLLLAAPAGFVNGVPVIFDDSGSATPSVIITEIVQPGGIIVSNTSTSYSFDNGGGKISGPTSLTKRGSGTLSLGTANDYTGATTIAAGTVQMGVVSALSASSIVTVTNTGILDVNGLNQTLAGLNGNGVVNNSIAAPAELFITGGGNFTGVIQNTAGGDLQLWSQNGTPLILSGTNAYTGRTYVQGALEVGSDYALGKGDIYISFVGALSSANTTAHTLTNGLVLDSGNFPTLGNAAKSGILTFTGPISTTKALSQITFASDVVFASGVVQDPVVVGAANITKLGTGTLTMNGVNTYSGTTAVNAGILAGNGTFTGPVTVADGAKLSPGTSIGTMTINSNLVLNGTSTMFMELNATSNTSDLVTGLTSVTFGGTLQVTNLAGTLTNGQSFQLFSAATFANNFAATNLPTLTGGLAWNWNPANGTLAVVSGVATNPTNITFTVSGGTNLNLTWPGDHLGWIAQSNSVSLANTNYWFDILGSSAVTNLSLPINASLSNVFYRLRLPN